MLQNFDKLHDSYSGVWGLEDKRSRKVMHFISWFLQEMLTVQFALAILEIEILNYLKKIYIQKLKKKIKPNIFYFFTPPYLLPSYSYKIENPVISIIVLETQILKKIKKSWFDYPGWIFDKDFG